MTVINKAKTDILETGLSRLTKQGSDNVKGIHHFLGE